MKGIPLYFHFRTSRASGADLYDRRCRYNSAIPPPQDGSLSNHLHSTIDKISKVMNEMDNCEVFQAGEPSAENGYKRTREILEELND